MKNIDKENISESLEDDNLRIFLHTYSPTPPEELKPCEDLIMRSLFVEKQETQGNKQWRWLIFPTAILTGILLVSAYLFKPNLNHQMASEYDEIEAFMINGWQGSMALSE